MLEFSENQFGVEQRREPESDLRQGVERRRHQRFEVEGEAEVIIAGLQLFRGRVIDLSLSGCFIETHARPNAAVGRHASLLFRANGLLVRATGSFRAFREGYGAGFVFVRMNEETRQALGQLIGSLE
jgi:hypothetical protein